MSFEALLRTRPAQARAEFGAAVDAALDGRRSRRRRDHRLHLRHDRACRRARCSRHRNMIYASVEVADVYGLDTRSYSVLCYLPLCHVAERSFSTVDATRHRLRRQLRGIGRHGRSPTCARSRRWAFSACRASGKRCADRDVSRSRTRRPSSAACSRPAWCSGAAVAERRLANGGRLAGAARPRCSSLMLWLVVFRAPAAVSRPRPGAQRLLRRRHDLAGSAAVLLDARRPGLSDLRHDRDRRRLLSRNARARPTRLRRAADRRRRLSPRRRMANSACAGPASSRAICSTRRRRRAPIESTAGLRTGDIVETGAQRRDPRRRPQEGHSHHLRRQEHHAFADRECAEGLALSSGKRS